MVVEDTVFAWGEHFWIAGDTGRVSVVAFAGDGIGAVEVGSDEEVWERVAIEVSGVDGAIPDRLFVWLCDGDRFEGPVPLVSIDRATSEVCDKQIGESVLVEIAHTDPLSVTDVGNFGLLCDLVEVFSLE